MKWFDDVKKYYAFSALVKRFALPIIVLYMVESGLSLQQIAIITAVSSIILLILEVPSGAIADTIGHRRALVIASIGQAISMALFLGGNVWWIACAVILYWASGTLLTGTSTALFYERLLVLGRGREFKKLSGRAKSIAQGVGIVFMATAGVLYMVHPWIPFVVGVLQFILAAIIIGSFGVARVGKVEKFEVALVGRHMKEAIRLLRKHKDIFWITISYATVVGASFALYEFEQVRMDELGLLAAGIGFMYAIKRAVGAVTPLTISTISKYLSDKASLILGIILLAFLFVATSLTQSIAGFVIGIFSMTAITITARLIIDNYINTKVKTLSRATLLSFNSLSMGLVKAIAVLGLGVMVDLIPLYAAFTILAIFILIITLVVFVPGLRHLESK